MIFAVKWWRYSSSVDKICKIFIQTSKLYRKLLNDPENAKGSIYEYFWLKTKSPSSFFIKTAILFDFRYDKSRLNLKMKNKYSKDEQDWPSRTENKVIELILSNVTHNLTLNSISSCLPGEQTGCNSQSRTLMSRKEYFLSTAVLAESPKTSLRKTEENKSFSKVMWRRFVPQWHLANSLGLIIYYTTKSQLRVTDIKIITS